MNEDFREFFALLHSHRVQFMLIGGMAYNVHAPPRATKDIDIWVRPTPKNLERLLCALEEFGLATDDVDPDDLRRNARVLMLGRVPNRIDVLTRPAGLTWATAWPRRERVDYGGVVLAVLGREDLIASKAAAGRPQDLVDADVLRTIAQRSRPDRKMVRGRRAEKQSKAKGKRAPAPRKKRPPR